MTIRRDRFASRLAAVLRLSLNELDTLLNSVGSLASRREVIVDAALPTGAAVATRVVGPKNHSADAAKQVAEIHRTYQAAEYSKAGTLLSPVTAAWEAADRARHAAETIEDRFGQAAAAYQQTCALLRGKTDQTGQAEHIALAAAQRLHGSDPASVTWRGALTLISAVIAARRNDRTEASRRLNDADDLARRLGHDDNVGWTAFGPTNVLIHRTSVAVALDDPYAALATAEQIDVTALPTGLHGRQAQFHLDSAWAHAQLGEDPRAVIHMLDTERVAPELIAANPNARRLIKELLGRERRRTVPGLRGLAVRAGVAA